MVEVQIADGPVQVFAFDAFERRVADGRVPDDARIRFEPITGDSFVPAADLEMFRALRDGAAVAWRQQFLRSGPPVLTALLVGLQVRIWFWVQLPDVAERVVRRGVNWLPPALEDGEPWRLLSYGLLHTDFLHILLNMVWMAYTGWNIERALGRWNLATIYFGAVFVGGLLSMFLTPGVPSLGASGGVYGLVAASVVFGFIRQDLLPERGRRLFGVALAPYLIVMFFSGLTSANTDNWAHFGGLITGAALAFVLDPPAFERRPRNNLRYQLGVAAFIVAVIGLLGVAGPRLHPLVEHEQARLDALPRAARKEQIRPDALLLTELEWSVPTGWKPGTTTAGDRAFVSPARGSHRAYGVSLEEDAAPVDIEALRERWIERAVGGREDVEVERPDPVPWLDQPATAVREARVRRADGRVMVWRGAARGTYALYRVIEHEVDDAARLAPLFARADRSIRWYEPIQLQGARRDLHATPSSVRARGQAAEALARWGEVDEAVALLEALAAERPGDPSRWTRYLRVAGWYPDRVALDPLIERALREAPDPQVVTEVARVLREAGRGDQADGVLQLAWLRLPGERSLRRALREAGLAWALDDAGDPVHLTRLPDGSARSPEQLAAWRQGPFTLQVSAEVARTLAAERRQLAEGLDQAFAEGRALELLLQIRDGGLRPAFGHQRLLRRELIAATAGRPAAWMGPEVVAALSEARVDALVEAIGAAASAGDDAG